jgi:hypothetical protein
LANEQASLRGEGGMAGSEEEAASEERSGDTVIDYLNPIEWQCPQCGKHITTPGETSMRTMQSLHLSTHEMKDANENFEKAMEAIRRPRGVYDKLPLTVEDRKFMRDCGIDPE